MGAESLLSKALNQGMKNAFNEKSWNIAKGHLSTFTDAVKNSGFSEALLGAGQAGARSGGLISNFVKFANGEGLEASEDILARKIGAYGGAALVGGGFAAASYALDTKVIKSTGEAMQNHPGAAALAIGGGVWAATAGKGITKRMFQSAQVKAAAGLGYMGNLGKS